MKNKIKKLLIVFIVNLFLVTIFLPFLTTGTNIQTPNKISTSKKVFNLDHGLPDFIITDFELRKDKEKSQYYIFPCFTIENTGGDCCAGDSTIDIINKIYVDDEYVEYPFFVPAYIWENTCWKSGESRRFEHLGTNRNRWGVKDTLEHKYTVIVDALNEVKEENEDNNNFTFIASVPNDAPNKPVKPTYYIQPELKFRFDTVATDDDSDEIQYGWDFDNDNVVDHWSKLYKSGEVHSVCNVEIDISQIKYVKVKARDAWGDEGEWSDPIGNKIRISQVSLRLFERFFLLFQLFKL